MLEQGINNTESLDEVVNNADFDAQFNNESELNGISTVNIKANKEMWNNPIIFAPGFSRTIKTFEDMLKEFSIKNRDTISLSHLREWWDIRENPYIWNVPDEVLRRATSLFTIIAEEIEYNIDNNIEKKIDLVWQSLWGIDTIVAAGMINDIYPWSLGSIVIVNSAGIIWKDRVWKLALRFKEQISKNLEITSGKLELDYYNRDWDDINFKPKRPLSAIDNQNLAAKEFTEYVKWWVVRSMKEWFAMCDIDLPMLMKELKNKSDVKIALVHWTQDEIFPLSKVNEASKGNNLADIVDWIYSVSWWHNELYLEPDKYVHLIDSALDSLNNLK